jgi:hypothetical protein
VAGVVSDNEVVSIFVVDNGVVNEKEVVIGVVSDDKVVSIK